MKKLVWLVSFMLFAVGALADVYRWTDSQGNTHFSDVPHDGAEKMNVPDAQSFSSPASKLNSQPADPDADEDKATPQEYTKIKIMQPKKEETIRNNDGSVVVSVQVRPQLFDEDSLQIIYDGTPMGEPQHNLNFQLRGIYRGSHTVAAQIVSADGKVLMTSDTVTFFMQRPRVGMGANGTPRPPSN